MGSVLSCVGSTIVRIGAWFVSGVKKVVGTIFEHIWKAAHAFFIKVESAVDKIVKWLKPYLEPETVSAATTQTCGVGDLRASPIAASGHRTTVQTQGTRPRVATEEPAQAQVPENTREVFHAMEKFGGDLQEYARGMIEVIDDSEQNGSVATTSRKLEDLNKQDFMKD
ncbi:uncharacterized protein LOC111346736 [Stylophora pistillata]|uniref:uncharacterized protein LOC111346736 n=1 Tax=Stylophora pistillata TaxID=50429 RepID=UPI000C043800|nr:uncharacterized protein LOC111346736 [Stylophora pistillata]